MASAEKPAYREYMSAAWAAIDIYNGPDAFFASFAAVPAPAADLVAAHWLVSEVRNGAFPQFFSNATGVLAPEAVQALRRLGLPEAAALVEEAMSFFDEPYPRDRAARQERIDWVWEDELSEGEQHNLDLMLEISGEFLDAIGRDMEHFIPAADAYARAHLGSG